MSKRRDIDLPARRPNVVRPDGTVPPGWEQSVRRFRRGVRLSCATPECPNFGRVWEDEIDDNADGIDRVLCGLCGEWIESIEDIPERPGATRDEINIE